MIKRMLMLAIILTFMSLPIRAGAQTVMTKDDVYRALRINFMAHNEAFTVNMDAGTLDEIGVDTDLLAAAVSVDDKSTSEDGEYLKVSVIGWKEVWKYDDMGKASITVTAQYRTTTEQEKLLSDKIACALRALDLKTASDYEKVKAIHDYIINYVTYDQSLQRYTAYDALLNHSAVCQGYAAAAYRMFTDAGIESRILSGVAGQGAHVWNIVKVNGKWYNIDLTWDDTVSASGQPMISYDYFLKNTDAFSDHARELQYRTKDYLETFPISSESYEY